MRIAILKKAISGGVMIPPGEYWVHLRPDTQEIALLAHGMDLAIPATRRSHRTRARNEAVMFYSSGGTIWSLIVMVPKLGEWIALIDYRTDKYKGKQFE
jgi:hypothetical protein